jgi:arylsulfatase A-like enzyme
MKAVIMMYDSLNRHMLPPYGCDWVHAPNFKRLAERTLVFDKMYVGSMPTIPARREMHTGRYNFLHRSWGPLEPFDNSVYEHLKHNGVSTHLVSDGYHYWEDGGATYHGRFSTWQFNRGQEGDYCIGDLTDAVGPPENLNDTYRNRTWLHQDWVNRHHMQKEEDQPQARTVTGGIEFLRTNHKEDNWLLQVETFDPHEPYFCDPKYYALYKDIDPYDGPVFDWPPYQQCTNEPENIRKHVQVANAALISMCDAWLGKLLDTMDELNLWDDTLFILCSDHGFLLGEHGWWGKCRMPFYDEVANTPLFVWDPRFGKRGERRQSLVQTIDIGPTLLDYFGKDMLSHMQGRPIAPAIEMDTPVRDAGLYGTLGGHVNVTDGRYVYMRASAKEQAELYEYTLMPTHMRSFFGIDVLAKASLNEPLPFTKGVPVLRIPSRVGDYSRSHEFGHLLFDRHKHPRQEQAIEDAHVEKEMQAKLVKLMKESDAPPELYVRLGLADQ